MTDCLELYRVLNWFAVGRHVALAATFVALAVIARSVPNEIRRRYGVPTLLRSLAPWSSWRSTTDSVHHQDVDQFRRRMHLAIASVTGLLLLNVLLIQWAARCR